MSVNLTPAPIGSARDANPNASVPPLRRVLSWRLWCWLGFSVIVGVGLWYWLLPYYWRSQAIAAIKARDLDRARRLLTKTVQRLPHDAASRVKLAQLLGLAGETEEAVSQLYLVPERMRNQEDVLINLGQMLIQIDRPTEAETYLLECIKRYPQSVRPRQLLLDIYLWQHRDAESLALRVELTDLARNKSISDRLWVMIRCFFEEYSKVDDQENWEHLLRCWNRDQQDPAVRIAMARHLLLQQDRVREAAQDLESLLPFQPGNLSAIASLVDYYLNIECQSIDRAEQLLAQWPEPLRFHAYWRYDGQIQEHRNDEAAALASYRQALDFRPDDLPSINCLGRLLVSIARRTGDNALLAEGKALAERVRQLHQTRARANQLWDRLSDWLDQWDKASQGVGDPPDSGIVKQMAEFYEELGRAEESRAWSEMYGAIETVTKRTGH